MKVKGWEEGAGRQKGGRRTREGVASPALPQGASSPRLSTMEAAAWPCPLQLSALVPGLFEGRQLPDAAVLQEGLNVLVAGPVWGVGQAPAAAAAAARLDPTAFAALRDE